MNAKSPHRPMDIRKTDINKVQKMSYSLKSDSDTSIIVAVRLDNIIMMMFG